MNTTPPPTAKHMSELRMQDVMAKIFSILAHVNAGPGRNIPIRTVWPNATKYGITSEELHAALSKAEAEGLLTSKPTGPGGFGTIALTEAGYERSRDAQKTLCGHLSRSS